MYNKTRKIISMKAELSKTYDRVTAHIILQNIISGYEKKIDYSKRRNYIRLIIIVMRIAIKKIIKIELISQNI